MPTCRKVRGGYAVHFPGRDGHGTDIVIRGATGPLVALAEAQAECDRLTTPDPQAANEWLRQLRQDLPPNQSR